MERDWIHSIRENNACGGDIDFTHKIQYLEDKFTTLFEICIVLYPNEIFDWFRVFKILLIEK